MQERISFMRDFHHCSFQRFEDTELVGLKNLPKPKLVITPPGLPNELFGDVAMVTEFIMCYKGLLMPDDKNLIESGKKSADRHYDNIEN